MQAGRRPGFDEQPSDVSIVRGTEKMQSSISVRPIARRYDSTIGICRLCGGATGSQTPVSLPPGLRQ